MKLESKATSSELDWLFDDRGDIICFFGRNLYIPIDNVCLFIRDNERIKASMRNMRDLS